MTRLTDQEKQQVKELLLKGYSVEDIARMLGVPFNSVLGVLSGLRRCGVIPRNARPRPLFADSQPTAPAGGTVYTAQPLPSFWTPQYQPQVQSPPSGLPFQPAVAAQTVSPFPVVQQPTQEILQPYTARIIPQAWQAHVVRRSKDEDAIDEFLKDEDGRLIRQARLSTVKLYIAEKRKSIEKVERETYSKSSLSRSSRRGNEIMDQWPDCLASLLRYAGLMVTAGMDLKQVAEGLRRAIRIACILKIMKG